MANQKQLPINPKNLQDIICECENHTFTPVVFLKRLSALLSPDGEEKIVPISAFACNACGVVPSIFLREIPFEHDNKKEEERKADSNDGIVQSNLDSPVDKLPKIEIVR